GLRFCRYADDCNIYVRSRRAGERITTSVSRFLTNKLRLKVNEAKSAVARPEERKFLGFSIANDGSERRTAPKALAKFKAQIREMTRRTRGFSLPQVIEDLAPYLLGWRGYFGFCQTPRRLCHGNSIEHALKAEARNTSHHCDGILPLRSRFGSEDPQGGSGDEVALKVEGVVNRAVHAEETLGGSS